VSLYDYMESRELGGYGFYTLLMALIRRADTVNLNKLEILFPDEVKEFRQRYNAPGGLLPGEN